jgi:L-2-hydroxyglutarate oxidase LhgO
MPNHVGIRRHWCGNCRFEKLIVALQAQLKELELLQQRAVANGVYGLRSLTAVQVRKLETAGSMRCRAVLPLDGHY